MELAGKERETSLALITALAHDHATYELSVVIRDLAGKDPQLTEIFVDYFTAIGITYLCMDDLLEDDSADDMPQRCRFCGTPGGPTRNGRRRSAWNSRRTDSPNRWPTSTKQYIGLGAARFH